MEEGNRSGHASCDSSSFGESAPSDEEIVTKVPFIKCENPDDDEFVYDNDAGCSLSEESVVKVDENPAESKSPPRKRWKLDESQMYIDPDGRYCCTICSKSFKSAYNLKLHFVRHLAPKRNMCVICKQEFSDVMELENHKVVAHKTCKFCGKIFQYSSDMKKHSCRLAPELPFKCSFCPKSFGRESTLKMHQGRHTGNLPHKCDHCSKGFANVCKLKRHVLIHTAEKPHRCDKCPKAFNDLWRLKEHVHIHESGKFVCYICHKELSTQWYLDMHLKTSHKQEKGLQCTRCPRAFYDIYKLREHLRSHDVVKKYECSICQKELSTSSHLRRHQHRVHKEQKCPDCDLTFNDIYQFRDHARTHAVSKKFLCPVCLGELPSQQHLARHMKNVHNEQKCTKCSETFLDSGLYLEHLRTHGSPEKDNQEEDSS